MMLYQKDNTWFVIANGGWTNQKQFPETELGPFSAQPVPDARWRQIDRKSVGGDGVSVYTLFTVEGVPAFTLQEFIFAPLRGNSWEEEWETLLDPLVPPTLGPAYLWTDEGWKEIDHPLAVTPC